MQATNLFGKIGTKLIVEMFQVSSFKFEDLTFYNSQFTIKKNEHHKRIPSLQQTNHSS